MACTESCEVKQFRRQNVDIEGFSVEVATGTEPPWRPFPRKSLLPQDTKVAKTALHAKWTALRKEWSVPTAPCPDGCQCAVDAGDKTPWKSAVARFRVTFTGADRSVYRVTATYAASTRRIAGECVEVEPNEDDEALDDFLGWLEGHTGPEEAGAAEE